MSGFSKQEQQSIKEAIENAEQFTSGEIRICVEDTCNEPVLDRAANYFKKLGMHKTTLRNGVLIYIAVKTHQFAILGDAGINKLVPENFWESTKDLMRSHFKEGKLSEGIVEGINLAGQQLQKYFPCLDGDVNELPNDITFMDGK